MRKDSRAALVIRRVTARNVDDLLSLVRALADFEKLTPPNAAASRRLRHDILSKNPKCEAYLGLLEGKPVAYVIFYFTYSSFHGRPNLFLEDIFVLEEDRRRGIGQAMFDLCVRRAREEGCARIEFTVLDWNKGAQEFYERNRVQITNWKFCRLELV